MIGNEVKIKLHARAEGGKANAELIEFLSKKLRVPRKDIKILRGFTSRSKVVEVKGLSDEEILKGLLK